MYYLGQGVPQDYKDAGKWFRLSAEQGLANAQHNLALMYATGKGVSQNHVLAHLWWNLASLQGNKDGKINIPIVEKKMTPQQIKEAQEMARNWKPTTK